MSKIEVYSRITSKKAKKRKATLSPEDALIQALNVIDFSAKLRCQNKIRSTKYDTINWIDLK